MFRTENQAVHHPTGNLENCKVWCDKVLALTQQYEGARAGLASPLFRTDESGLRFPLCLSLSLM